MRRTRRTDQNGTHRKRVRQRLDHLIRDIGGIEIGHDQDIGLPFQLRMRQDQLARGFRKRGIALHLAVRLDLRMLVFQKRGCLSHLARGVRIKTSKVGM